MKASLIRNQIVLLNQGRFRVEIRVYGVEPSRKFPMGIKLTCVLIDVEQSQPMVLLDNHEPFGFHLHSRLPEDPNFRVSLEVANYEEAISLFFKEVRRVVSDEE
jgi:hypothetical protein